MTARRRVWSGAPWEGQAGYCRAVRVGAQIWVSGTAPVAAGGGVHAPGNAYAQARHCIDILGEALRALDADLSSVVRTRMFVTDIARWPDVVRAHREAFADHPPATTMVEVKALIDPAMLVEIEADAVVDEPASAGSSRP